MGTIENKQNLNSIKMKHINILFCILWLFSTFSCKQHSESIKHYNALDSIKNVKENIHEIAIEDIEISNFGTPFILNDYLIISDYKSFDKLIHIFDKNTFTYLTSVGDRGQGPSEIANMGSIIPDEKNNSFYVFDHGHQLLYNYPMDSVLSNPAYLPEKKADIDASEFPFQMQYVNDTLSYALYMHVLNPGDYTPMVGKWNMLTGKTDFMEYTGHPEITKKRVSFAASVENNLYAEVYWYHDLITLCTLDGKLKYTLYGAQWDNRQSYHNGYYMKVAFCKDKLIADYLGGVRFTKNEKISNDPTRLIVFDLNGNHLTTLEIGYSIISFCYDNDNNRLIFAFNDDIQFGYLDLNNII